MDVKFSISNNKYLLDALCFISKYQGDDITINVDYENFLDKLEYFSTLTKLNPTIVLDVENLDIDTHYIKTIGLKYNLRFFIRYKTSTSSFMLDNLAKIEKIKTVFGIIDLALEIDKMPDIHFLSKKIEFLGFKHIDFAVKTDSRLWKQKIEWLKEFQSISYDKNYLIYNLFKNLKNVVNLQYVTGIDEQKSIMEKDLKSNIFIDDNLNFMSYGIIGENIIHKTSLTLKSNAVEIEKHIKELTQKIIINYLKDKRCIGCDFKNVCMLAGGYVIKSKIDIDKECQIGIKDNFQALLLNTGRKEYISGKEENLYPNYLTHNYPENYIYK